MAANSVSLPATRIMTEALRHIRYLVLEELTERCSEALSLDSISWILTVPAIWNKSTRQLIKEIAIEVRKDAIFLTTYWHLTHFAIYVDSIIIIVLLSVYRQEWVV